MKYLWYRYIKGFSPDFVLTKSGVKLLFCKKCTSPVILHKLVFLPIRFYKSDNELCFNLLSDYIRKAFLK